MVREPDARGRAAEALEEIAGGIERLTQGLPQEGPAIGGADLAAVARVAAALSAAADAADAAAETLRADRSAELAGVLSGGQVRAVQARIGSVFAMDTDSGLDEAQSGAVIAAMMKAVADLLVEPPLRRMDGGSPF